MTLEASVLAEHAVRSTRLGYQIDLHLPWYRSLPLSCLEDLRISIGGESVDSPGLRLVRGGQTLGFGELAARVDDEWFVQDAITVEVPSSSPRAKGQTVDVEVLLTLRVPYIIIGPGKALTRPTRIRRRLVLQ